MTGHDNIFHTPEKWFGSWRSDIPLSPTVPDPPAPMGSEIDAALNGFIAAANAGDIPRDLEHQKDQQNRSLKYEDALRKFPGHEEQASTQMDGVTAQSESQMAQMMPQMVSGLVGAITGALGGALAPLAQIPQQVAQAGQQAMQAGMSAMQSASQTDEREQNKLLADKLASENLPASEMPKGSPDVGSAGPGGGMPDAGTMPTAVLGPPVIPSPTTIPAAAITPVASVGPTAATTTPYAAGMGGMPFIPPGAMANQGANANDDKTDTKRVAVPPVKNGAPVQGRFTAPPEAPVTKRVEGKPVTTRRIVTPDEARATETIKDDADKK